jgi:protein-S-isoprenylcysteine O-methyltransferase Ste14
MAGLEGSFVSRHFLFYLFVLAVLLRHALQFALVRGQKKSGVSSGLASTAALAACYIVVFAAAARSLWGRAAADIPIVLGFALMAAFVAVRFLALVQLGRNFSYDARITDGHSLVTGGIYGVTRHPLHLSFFGEVLGMAVISMNPLAIPVLAALLFVILHRNRMEDRMLEERFQDQFREYRDRVPSMIPAAFLARFPARRG